jgi:hypothetical protein
MMLTLLRPLARPVLCLALAAPLAACTIDIRDNDDNQRDRVDIRTPVGRLSVNGDVDASETGLPVYPGARAVRERDHDGGAHVTVANSWFGINVVAAKFDSDAAPQALVDYYRKELGKYGAVTECRGDIDFKGPSGNQRAECDEKPSSREVQLMTGTSDRRRIVSVKPKGDGAEFALVYLQTRDDR